MLIDAARAESPLVCEIGGLRGESSMGAEHIADTPVGKRRSALLLQEDRLWWCRSSFFRVIYSAHVDKLICLLRDSKVPTVLDSPWESSNLPAQIPTRK